MKYKNYTFYVQPGWSSPNMVENPTDLSYANGIPHQSPNQDCTNIESLTVNQNGFVAYSNYNGYYNGEEALYQQGPTINHVDIFLGIFFSPP